VRSDPADEEMNLLFAEGILTDHPVIVATHIKYHPASSATDQISGPKRALNVRRLVPVGVLHCCQPCRERRLASGIPQNIVGNRLFPYQMNSQSNIRLSF